ncbi:MAG: L,D-transpeptidase [Verrucomicrobiae bacterium]|nr:L,D-transpeptidase [Verrucomicrobiae bacterium]
MFHLSRVFRATLPSAVAAGAAFGLASCAIPGSTTTGSDSTPDFPTAGGTATAFSMRQKYGGASQRYVPSGREVETTTRENFFAWLFSGDGEPKTKKAPAKPTGPVIPATKVNDSVLAKSNSANTRIVIDIARQKAFLLVGDSVAIESPVSTARPGKHTPRGSFRISERVRSGKISTIYGVGMPYWMRLSGSAYGVHAGYLPGYPASAGCIRLPSESARMIYDNTKYGTRVSIYDSWSGA